MSIAILFASDFNPGDPAWGFWLNLVAIAFAIVGPPSIVPLLVYLFRKPKKQLSYYTESDAALIDERKDLGEDMTVLFQGGALHRPTPMNDARLIMFKIINTGSDIIRKEDFSYDEQSILRFRFAEPKLILCAVHHTEPEHLIPPERRKSVIELDPLTPNISPSSPIIVPNHARHQSMDTLSFHRSVDLHGRTLQSGNAIVLKFVTQGRVEMKLDGSLLGGKIVPYVPSPPIFTVPRILVGLLVAFVSVLSIFTFGAFRQNGCVPSFSPISVGGSSAFYTTVQAQANAYHQGCPFLTVNSQSSDSADGLQKLVQNNLDIANSEITPQEAGVNDHDLSEHQVAVIVFTMIVNKEVGIGSLSQDQIKKIYNGQYTNWNQLNGPNLPIVPFERPSGSGTQTTFTRYVLQGLATAPHKTPSSTQEIISQVGSTKGAIGYVDLGSANQASNTVTAISINDKAPTPGLVENGEYPFWAIERMYTKQDTNNPLVSAFVTYVIDHIQTNTTFIKKSDMQASALAQHE
jgi:phosphate transport system substrate-binding protein